MRTTRLASVLQAPGPYASVTLEVGHDDENGDHEHQLRVRAACEELRDAGAADAVVEAVSERLFELVDRPAPMARTVVANADGVLLDDVLHARVDRPEVAWGPLPELGTWLTLQETGGTPFVLAVVDHVGGDVAVCSTLVTEPLQEESAGGETFRVHKVPTGGWSALRYQHVVENVWKENAEAVAEEITRLVRQGRSLVLVAGDPQSRPQVVNALGAVQAEVVELETGTRAEDGGDEALQEAVREAVFAHTAARGLALAHELAERRGRENAVATGVDDVADAFVRGQVETLLIDPVAADGLTLDPARHPGLALGSAPLDAPLPASAALVAAAALTSAEVSVSRARALGGDPVGALLRWDQSAQGSSV
jgi:Bacterial archaeo-eukaryotic release factor family 2